MRYQRECSCSCCWKGRLEVWMVKCLRSYRQARWVWCGVTVCRENGDEDKKLWEMGTKMLIKCGAGVWSEKPLWEWGRGSKNSGADCACEAWLKHLWDLRRKPRLPGLVPLVLSAFAAASPHADTSVEEFAALRDCASRISAVTVEVLSLLMVHGHVMGEMWPLSWGTL